MWFIGVTPFLGGAPLPKKNPGSAPVLYCYVNHNPVPRLLGGKIYPKKPGRRNAEVHS